MIVVSNGITTAGFKYSHMTTDSADWVGLSNSIMFFDIDTEKVYWKNSSGDIIDIVSQLDDAKAYADTLVVGLWDDRGGYDASVNAYPSTGGSGIAGAIKKGDLWTITVAGTLPTGQVVAIGGTVRALVDTAINTQSDWSIMGSNIGYVAENEANKTDIVSGNEASSIKYLSVKGVYDYVIGLFVQKNASITGATKTKVTYDTKGLVTSGTDATTSDIADSSNKRYVTDAQLTVITNTSGTNTGDETTATIKTKLGVANTTDDGYLLATDWNTFNNKQTALGFTPENVANKSTSIVTDQASNTKYPSVKSVYDWAVATFQSALGFTPENVANKSLSVNTDQASNTKYPSVKSVYDWGAGLFATISNLNLKQDVLTSSNFGSFANGLTAKSVPLNADLLNLVDSADSNNQKKVSNTDYKAFLKTYFDTLYTGGGSTIIKGAIWKCNLEYLTASTIKILVGELTDSANTMNLVVSSDLTINLASSGVNGLDTGAEAISTWYYAFVIYNPTTLTYASLCSVSATPTLPTDYTKYRCVGCFRNNASSNIIKMYYEGYGSQRTVMYDDSILSVVSNGSSTSFSSVSLVATLSPLSKVARLNLMCYNISGDRNIAYVSGSSTSTSGSAYNMAGNQQESSQVICPAPSQTIYYKVTTNGRAYINVDGYIEQV